jgi:hypothetical protein
MQYDQSGAMAQRLKMAAMVMYDPSPIRLMSTQRRE